MGPRGKAALLSSDQQNTGLLHNKKLYFSYAPQSNKLYEQWILAGLFLLSAIAIL
jgi:hypothetical protein